MSHAQFSVNAPARQAPPLSRGSQTFFLRPSFGFANYMGDNNPTFSGFGLNGMAEIGYQFAYFFSLSGLYSFSDYGSVLRPDPRTNLPRAGSNTRLSSLQAMARYTFGGRRSTFGPYIHAGVGGSFGGDHPDDAVGWGPVLGVGVDVMVTESASFFAEYTTNAIFPDTAIDGPDRNEFGSYDLLNRFSLGVRFNIRQQFVPVVVSRIEGPTMLEVGQPGSFVPQSNVATASAPITFQWNFGDGTVGTDQNATHTFGSAGTYIVTFTAQNGRSTDTASHTVVVINAPVRAEIVAMNVSPQEGDTRTPIAFSATVLGDQPRGYRWSFGDGNTSTEHTPTHTYAEPGNYVVALTASNEAGSDEQTMRIRINPYEAGFCELGVELTSVFFERNSSFLSPVARSTLQENLDVLLDCPNVNVRVDGYAEPNERNGLSLSEDRARAVEEYYVRNGVTFSRVLAQGHGVQEGGKLKEGREQFRRADTTVIP